MADIGKVTPGSPVIPPVPQDRRVGERDKRERERKQDESPMDDTNGTASPADSDDKGKGEDGIDVYV